MSQGRDVPTLEDYRFDLRDGLKMAAKAGLAQLEEMISEVGYGWLEGYMEGIMEREFSKGPITELMKTPSRTQTVKKTRAATTAAKQRSVKLHTANVADTAINVSPTTQQRQPFSPLFPRSMNVEAATGLSPVRVKSLAVSTKGGKGGPKAKRSTKSKKGKPTKALNPDMDNEMVVDEQAEDVAAAASVSPSLPATVNERGTDRAAEASQSTVDLVKSTSTRSRKPAKAIANVVETDQEPSGQMMDVQQSKVDDTAQDPLESIEMEDTEDPLQLEDNKAVESSDPGKDNEQAEESDLELEEESQDEVEEVQATPIVLALPETEMVKQTISGTRGPESAALSPAVRPPTVEQTAAFEIPNASSTVPATTAPIAGPSAPLRQVRSSWLSKALGGGGVTSSALLPNDANSARASNAVRPGRDSSFAPMARSHPPTTYAPMDFARKSVVQSEPLSSKRKSQVGADEAQEDVNDRPEKMPRTNPIFPRDRSSASRDEAARPSIFNRPKSSIINTPGFTLLNSTTPGPSRELGGVDSAGKTEKRADISKISKALDDFRERAAAKEAATKAKAALSASTTSTIGDSRASISSVPRGVGSLSRGMGLGGTAKDAENMALRLQRELEEEEAAEREVKEKSQQALMEMPDREEKVEEDRSLLDEVFSPATVVIEEEPMSDAQEEDDVAKPEIEIPREDLEEEDQIADELEPVEPEKMEVEQIPAPRPKSPTPDTMEYKATPPAREPPAAAVSHLSTTTPAGPPPGFLRGYFRQLFQPFAATAESVQASETVQAQEAQGLAARKSLQEQTTSSAERATKNDNHVPPRPIKSPERPKTAPAMMKPMERVTAMAPLPIIKPIQPVKPMAMSVHPVEGAKRPAVQSHVLVDSNDSDILFSDGPEDPTNLPDLPEPVEIEEDKTDSEVDMEEEMEDDREVPASKMFKAGNEVTQSARPGMAKSSSAVSLAVSSTAGSDYGMGMLSHASMIAGKTLGFKPTTGPVKSLQLAAAAAKKEQAANDRKAQARELIESRKAEVARRKEEEDRAKAEEERKVRQAELEEKRRLRLALERQRKEREEKIAAQARAKKEEEDRAKAAEEEAARKRKAVQMSKAAQPPLKRIPPPAPLPSSSASGLAALPPKPKDPLRVIKPALPTTSVSNGVVAGGSKLGPTVFKTSDMPQSSSTMSLVQPSTSTASLVQTSSSTINLVQAQSSAAIGVGQLQPERRPLGPPSRPSQQQASGNGHVIASGSSVASAILHKSRINLQAQLDDKVLQQASEDIVLPDIASEYSNSDDSESESDFKPPQWAESPDLKAALEAQSRQNPDEFFPPIKPVNMDELFKSKKEGKFRARSSSANWHDGDGITRAEKVEYAARMGFKNAHRAVSGSRQVSGSSVGGRQVSGSGSLAGGVMPAGGVFSSRSEER